jgi:hypothetical protein
MSDTITCAKRALRIDALRAKADSTEYEPEAVSLRTKADELEAINIAAGYVPEPKRDAYTSAWDQFFGREYAEQMRADKLRAYQDHIRRSTHATDCSCEPCAQDRVNKAASDALFDMMHPRKTRRTAKPKCPYCYPDAMCDKCFQAKYGQSRRDYVNYGDAPRSSARGSHAECYANGVHDNSKAGRAACRRSRS